MSIHKFAQQIEWLLWTGAIKGNQILMLHKQLRRYIQGSISDAEMQGAIDNVDPDLMAEPHWEENPLDL